MERKEAIKVVRNIYQTDAEKEALETLIPELRESEDERIIQNLIDAFTEYKKSGGIDFHGVEIDALLAWLKKLKELFESGRGLYYYDGEKITYCGYPSTEENPYDFAMSQQEKQKEQKPNKMEVYEVGKGTTIYGQDYKCKKDYKVGNCWYIKDVIYHCSRDGYLNDQNGVSWSCTPEWFKEYIQSNAEWAEEEKTRFVSGQFLQCKLSFDEFKEGEHYWLEYVGDDTYVGRSDNILNLRFHITPRQLYTLFSQQIEEKQKEQKLWEWSKEETKDLVHILKVLDDCYIYGKHDLSKTDYDNLTSTLKSLRPQPKQKRQIKEGDKVSIHCRKDRKEGIITIYDGKVSEVIHVWDAKRNPWGHIGVRLDNGCNNGFYEDELEVLDEPSWKPSEEQMTNLLRAEGRLRIEGESVLASKLAELYEQLKKL